MSSKERKKSDSHSKERRVKHRLSSSFKGEKSHHRKKGDFADDRDSPQKERDTRKFEASKSVEKVTEANAPISDTQKEAQQSKQSDYNYSDQISKSRKNIIYIAGIEDHMNTISRIYLFFHKYGKILGIQINREEKFALVEFSDFKAAFNAVYSKKPVFNNKLIKRGFASHEDPNIIQMFLNKDMEINKQRKEMRTDPDFAELSDNEYAQTDSESYDMPDDVLE